MVRVQDEKPAEPFRPDMNAIHDRPQAMTEKEKQVFDYLIKPDDSYDCNGVYWADLNPIRRITFVSAYDAGEVKRELGNIWAMAKRDPLAPVSYYIRNMIIPGAGLGLEGYSPPE